MLRRREFFGIRFVACGVFFFAFFRVIFFVRSHYDQLAERDFRLRSRASLKSLSRDSGIRMTSPFSALLSRRATRDSFRCSFPFGNQRADF